MDGNAVTEIIECYLSGNCHMDEINPGAIADFEQMKEKVMFKLINGEENKFYQTIYTSFAVHSERLLFCVGQ